MPKSIIPFWRYSSSQIQNPSETERNELTLFFMLYSKHLANIFNIFEFLASALTNNILFLISIPNAYRYGFKGWTLRVRLNSSSLNGIRGMNEINNKKCTCKHYTSIRWQKIIYKKFYINYITNDTIIDGVRRIIWPKKYTFSNYIMNITRYCKEIILSILYGSFFFQ